MRIWALAGLLCCLVVVASAGMVSSAYAAPVPVRYVEGTSHGFIVLQDRHGAVLANGQLIQTVRGERLESRLLIHFTDGSRYDETVTFTQHSVFRLVAYHLIQKGPKFGEASSEVTFDRDSGRYRATSGDKSAEGTVDIPEDVHNGMTGMLIRNLAAGGRATGYILAFTPKPQLVRSEMAPEGEDRFKVGEASFTAVRYLVKLEVPGLKGTIANLIGKNPPDIRYWVSSGPVPAFMKFEGAMYLKGPVWTIELAPTRWLNAR
jgi:hypothetical protein